MINPRPHASRRIARAAAALAPVTLVAMMAATTSAAGAAPLSAAATPLTAATTATTAITTDATEPTLVASGLNNPRGLSFSPRGDLYVAEAGLGGDGECVLSPENSLVCLGATGSVTKVALATGGDGTASRVLTGLPSLAGEGSFAASGPMDVVSWQRDRLDVAVGLGNSPENRDALGEDGALLGTLVTAGEGDASVSVVADLVAFEAAADPHPAQPDSNPSSLVRQGSSWTVADAGGNDLLSIDKDGAVSAITVFPDTMVQNPFAPPGVVMPMQAVPTAVAVGPDGAWYVSQLTGFPFPAGASTIWRVAEDGTRTPYATGLTNVTDLAWDRGVLYAVQIADAGLLNVPPGSLPTGSLRVVTPGASEHQALAEGLTAPYGVALRHGQAYVTECSMCPGFGSVVSVPTD